MIELRATHRISVLEMEQKIGKIVTEHDYNYLLTGPTLIRTPEGPPLCVYLPGYLLDQNLDVLWDVLGPLRSYKTDNRGLASGSERVQRGTEKRKRALPVASSILGSFDPGGPKQFCRLTSWTGANAERFALLRPALQAVAAAMERYVPARYERQMKEVRRTHPDWVISGTPFTTITVNNTYPTGVHKDAGDLAEGFSSIFCLRRGKYEGGVLTFPEYRVGVDLQHGDLLLMDAHQWHGNTEIDPDGDGHERITVVSYFRSGMVKCGNMDKELAKARAYAERRGGIGSAE